MTDEVMHSTSSCTKKLPGQIVSVGPDVFLKSVRSMVRMGLHHETRLVMQPHLTKRIKCCLTLFLKKRKENKGIALISR